MQIKRKGFQSKIDEKQSIKNKKIHKTAVKKIIKMLPVTQRNSATTHRIARKAIVHAALQKQSTEPVDNSVCNMLIDSVNGQSTRLCYKLMNFSPNL